MIRHRLLIMTLCLGLGACSGKLPGATAGKATPAKPLSQMSKDFLYLAAQDAIRQGQQALAIQFLNALVKKNPETRTPRMQLAELLLRANRPDQAIFHIDAITGEEPPSSATNPEEAEPHILRARALAMSGEPERALELLSTLLSRQPGLLNARTLHISILVNMKRVDEAYLSIATGLRHQETVELRKIQADLLIRQNRLDEAVKVLEAMQKLDMGNESSVLLLSQIALQQKNRARAEQLLRNHIEEYPDAIRVRNALGRLLVQSGRMLEAVTVYKGLVRDTGGTAEALSSLGLLYFQLKDYENAASQFRKALKNAPDDQSRFYLAASLEALERRDEAKQLYNRIKKGSSAYVDAQLRLAGLELASENINAAEKRIKAILSEYSDTADAYMLLSSIYLSQEKYRQLLDETEAALNLPGISSRLLFNRAVAHEHFRQYDGVENSLKRLLSTEPEHPEALNFLGYIYAEQGIKLAEAEALIQRALKQKPNDGYYLDSLAWVYFQRGDYNRAIEIQTKAIKQISDDPVIFEHMGDILWKSGKEDEARHSWEKALQLKHSKPKLIKKKIDEGLADE